MPSDTANALLGTVAIVLGGGLLLIAQSYPTTFCVSGTGMEPTCTTSTRRLATAALVLIAGLVTTGVGGVTLWRAR